RLAPDSSFDILDLFAKFFQLGFQDNDFTGNKTVVGLGTEGVDFAIDFLRQKIEGAPHWFPGFDAVVELLKVALETGQFLGDVGAVGKIKDFLEQTVVLKGGRF